MIASTWIGKSTPSVLLGAVSLFPSEPSTATPRAPTNSIAVGCRPALASAVFHGPNLGQPPRMSGADQQDVALAHADALLALGRLEVLGEDVLTGLEPGHAAKAGDVEQDAASHEPILEHLDRVDIGTVAR